MENSWFENAQFMYMYTLNYVYALKSFCNCMGFP